MNKLSGYIQELTATELILPISHQIFTVRQHTTPAFKSIYISLDGWNDRILSCHIVQGFLQLKWRECRGLRGPKQWYFSEIWDLSQRTDHSLKHRDLRQSKGLSPRTQSLHRSLAVGLRDHTQCTDLWSRDPRQCTDLSLCPSDGETTPTVYISFWGSEGSQSVDWSHSEGLRSQSM